MFDSLKLLRVTPSSLRVQTRKGSDIVNEVALSPETHQVEKYRKMRAKHSGWRHRRAACGVYNCYGHVFASRRTSIYEDVEVDKILREDGYVRIGHVAAQVGDVAIYRNKYGFVHAAQLVEIGEEDPSTKLRPAWALSKWDDGCGEDRHLISDVPFEYEGEIEIWTDRNL